MTVQAKGDGPRPGSAARSGGSRTRRWSPARAGSPATCRRRIGCASCAVRSRPGGSFASWRPKVRRVDHRRRSCRGEADPANAAQVQLRAGRPAGAGDRCGALRRRADRGRAGADARGSRGHRGSRRSRNLREACGRRCARGARARRRARARRGEGQRHRRRAREDAGLRRQARGRAQARQDRHPLAPAECAAAGAARGARRLGSDQPARDAPLQHADAARHADDHRRARRHAGIRPAGDRAGRGRRLRPEDVAGGRICDRDLAGAQAQNIGRLDGRPARESRRLLPQPRPVRFA